MSLLILLIIIPMLTISFALYIMTLINFISFNELDTLMITISILLILVLSFISGRLFIKTNKNPLAYILNLDNNYINIFGFYSLNIIGILGICLLVNSFIYRINLFNFGIGIFIVIVYVYLLYAYLIDNKNIVLKLEVISEEDGVNMLYLKDADGKEYDFYVNHSDKYIEDKTYLCRYNKMSKEVRKIIKEVKEV